MEEEKEKIIKNCDSVKQNYNELLSKAKDVKDI